MISTAFDTDSYEDQFALVLLETLMKKDVLTHETYRTVKEKIKEKEENIIGTSNSTNCTSCSKTKKSP